MNESSSIGEARRTALSLAGDHDFSESGAGNVAIVATEMATNLLRHAGGGEVLLRVDAQGPDEFVELMALDHGPGMSDLGRCMRDGYSTVGGIGTGLGAMARLAHSFDIYSHTAGRPGTDHQTGTAVLARLWRWPSSAGPPPGSTGWGVVSLPQPGETICGDAYARVVSGDTLVCAVVDGLGHGPLASEAAQEFRRVFAEWAANPVDLPAFFEQADRVLRKTRGAAASVATLNSATRQVRYAGIGNIAASLHDGAGQCMQRMISHGGIVGHRMRRIQEFEYLWPSGGLLIMHSDGLSTNWNLGSYPNLSQCDPSLLAGRLYYDYKRGRDDVTVFVTREPVP